VSERLVRDALLSDDQRYRYWLSRTWREQPGFLLWIMLNPSTADALTDDATIRKCMGFARRWGYGSITVVNLYALRSTNPAALEADPDPVGPDNDEWICRLAAQATGIMAGWGASGPRGLKARAVAVNAMLPNVEVCCIGQTRDGYPRHPSRPGYATPVELYFSKHPGGLESPAETAAASLGSEMRRTKENAR
jgi:hypothetical protein